MDSRDLDPIRVHDLGDMWEYNVFGLQLNEHDQAVLTLSGSLENYPWVYARDVDVVYRDDDRVIEFLGVPTMTRMTSTRARCSQLPIGRSPSSSTTEYDDVDVEVVGNPYVMRTPAADLLNE